MGFSNVLLLQEITRNAIKEERVRLARELHDEIGPSLASLGLALDVAMVQGIEDPALAGNLAAAPLRRVDAGRGGEGDRRRPA